jgi:hypothetical protein
LAKKQALQEKGDEESLEESPQRPESSKPTAIHDSDSEGEAEEPHFVIGGR